MAKRKKCTKEDCFWTLISEAGIYGFICYSLFLLNVGGNIYLSALWLLVLLNVAIFACPVMRKHFL